MNSEISTSVISARTAPQLEICTHPNDSATIHDLAESRVTVGRISENLVQIEDASVSSRHATLTLNASGDYILRDVGSTNGTLLNGEPINPQTDYKLKDGDKISFGKIDALYIAKTLAPTHLLPAKEISAVVAATSARPADFSNASPFQIKRKKRDAVGILLFITAALAIGAWGYAIFRIYAMQVPAF